MPEALVGGSSRKGNKEPVKTDRAYVKGVAPSFTARQKSSLQRAIRLARAYSPEIILWNARLALDDKFAIMNMASIQDRQRAGKLVTDIGVPKHLIMAVASEVTEPVDFKAIFREVLSEMVLRTDATDVAWEDAPALGIGLENGSEH